MEEKLGEALGQKDKPLLKVFIPGLFCTKYVFDEIIEQVEKSFECVAITFPYQDKNKLDFLDEKLGNFSFRQKIDYLVYLLKIVEKENYQYDLIGHSAGSALVLKLASRSDVNPRKIFLIAPAGTYFIFSFYKKSVFGFFPMLKSSDFWNNIPVVMNRDDVEEVMLNRVNSVIEKFSIYNEMVPESSKYIKQLGLWFLDLTFSSFVFFSNIRCPVDIFTGTEDVITPVKISRKIYKIFQREGILVNIYLFLKKLCGFKINPIPLVNLFEFEGRGHWLLTEIKEEITKAVISS